MSAAHLLTAVAYYVIGLVLIVVALRLWWTHPVNRVFVLGPYLTEPGLRLVLRHWPFTFLFGAFIFSCAVEHHADWLAMHGRASAHTVEILGMIEAAISWWTAGSILWLVLKAGWSRLWRS